MLYFHIKKNQIKSLYNFFDLFSKISLQIYIFFGVIFILSLFKFKIIFGVKSTIDMIYLRGDFKIKNLYVGLDVFYFCVYII